MKRTSLLVNLPILIAAPVSSWGSNGVAQSSVIEVRPNQGTGIDGITYKSAWNALPAAEKVHYGTPLLLRIIALDEKIYFDIATSQFDDIVVRVPLEELLSQPNRVEPPPEKPQ